MADITLSTTYKNNATNIGAIICRAPKAITNASQCILLKTIDDLIINFGDPYINPSDYTGLTIAYKLLQNSIPIYVSSIYEMQSNNDDEFDIKYNGYTEFIFKDSLIGYKLKSDIKFCQPIIQPEFVSASIININVILFVIDNEIIKTKNNLNTFDASQHYKTLKFVFNTSTLTDELLITTFKKYGLELKVLNGVAPSALANTLIRNSKVRITNNTETTKYTYDLHTNEYAYNFSTEEVILDAYTTAINNIATTLITPNVLTIDNLFSIQNTFDKDNNIVQATSKDLTADLYFAIYSILLNKFTEDNDTYLFINTPDVSVSSLIKILSNDNEYADIVQLNKQYNCDLYYGRIVDYLNSSLTYNKPTKVYYSVALLSMYNLLISADQYMTNSLAGLNIANSYLKYNITESDALALLQKHCNSAVLFDTGAPSIYGDYSLSNLPNLQYSHISRSFVALRKVIREYIETQKFILNTAFNQQQCLNYIQYNILDAFKTKDILADYELSAVVQQQTVNINIKLTFFNVATSINLNFII